MPELEVSSRYILSAEDFYHPHPQHPEHSAPEACVFRFWRHRSGVAAPLRLQPRGPWPTAVLDAPVALAYVNHGTWMVDCPHGKPCNSAQYASRLDHRFFCVDCDAGGTSSWVTVRWPDEIETAAIEAALGVRPFLSKRNWEPPEMRAAKNLPPETSADLLAENKAHGVA